MIVVSVANTIDGVSRLFFLLHNHHFASCLASILNKSKWRKQKKLLSDSLIRWAILDQTVATYKPLWQTNIFTNTNCSANVFCSLTETPYCRSVHYSTSVSIILLFLRVSAKFPRKWMIFNFIRLPLR